MMTCSTKDAVRLTAGNWIALASLLVTCAGGVLGVHWRSMTQLELQNQRLARMEEDNKSQSLINERQAAINERILLSLTRLESRGDRTQ